MKEISYTAYGQLMFPNDNKSKDSIKLLDLSEFGIDQKYLTPNFLNTQNYVIGKKIVSLDGSFFGYKNVFYEETLLDTDANIKIAEKKRKIDPNLKVIEVEKDFYVAALRNSKLEEREDSEMFILLIIGVIALFFALGASTDIRDSIAILAVILFVVFMIIAKLVVDTKHDYYVFRIGPNKILLIRK